MLMINQTSAAQIATLTDRDILIRPELGDIGLVDFERTLEPVPKGTAAAIFYRRVAGVGRYLTNTPLYLGATIEAGNAWNERADMSFSDLRWSSSVFLGADTLIGPVYLGTAIGTGGQVSGFLYVGQLF